MFLHHQKNRGDTLTFKEEKEYDKLDEIYWDYHDVLFANQTALSNENLKKYASDLGYDIGTCLDENKYADEVDKDMKEGASYGVTGTPAFFINGRKLVGAQPFSAFEAIPHHSRQQ